MCGESGQMKGDTGQAGFQQIGIIGFFATATGAYYEEINCRSSYCPIYQWNGQR